MKFSKEVLIAGAVGILIGWFGARQLQQIAYTLHLPRPDWERVFDKGYGI